MITNFVRDNAHLGYKELIKQLNKKLIGLYNYYGISGNFQWLINIYNFVKVILRKWLSRRSQKGKISWEKTSGQNEYQAVIGKNSVSVKYHPATDFPIMSEDGKDYVSLLIWNSEGENIDELKADSSSFDYSTLYNLYENARRACMKVEETLDEMMADLD